MDRPHQRSFLFVSSENWHVTTPAKDTTIFCCLKNFHWFYPTHSGKPVSCLVRKPNCKAGEVPRIILPATSYFASGIRDPPLKKNSLPHTLLILPPSPWFELLEIFDFLRLGIEEIGDILCENRMKIFMEKLFKVATEVARLCRVSIQSCTKSAVSESSIALAKVNLTFHRHSRWLYIQQQSSSSSSNRFIEHDVTRSLRRPEFPGRNVVFN